MHQAEVLAACLKMAPVIPVLVVGQVADAVPLATALVEGGLPALEVTLRTPAALEAIREMSAVPGSAVGAGTVLDARQAEQAVKAGAQFLVVRADWCCGASPDAGRGSSSRRVRRLPPRP